MAIQKLEVYGFRSLHDVTWEPGPLNLLVGPNGSGKSNLIRALELISNTARGGLAKYMNESRGMVSILWDHAPGSLGWRLRIDPVDEGRDTENDALTYELELAQLGGGSGYQITKDTLGNWQAFEQKKEVSPHWIYSRDASRAFYFDQQTQKLAPWEGELDSLESGESLLSQIADKRNRIPTRARKNIGSWAIYHDVRVERGSPMRLPATTQFVNRLEPDGSNLVQVLHTLYTGDRDFQRQIDEGMRAGFGVEYEQLKFQPAAAEQIQLAVQWKSSRRPHSGQDLSDGTLRFLFLLTALANPELPPVIAIDEPEAGLNPSMLPIIAEYAAQASERAQVITTSHSPEFLDAFSSICPRITLCHWEDGRTHLRPLPTEALGRWLARYRLGELFTSGDLESLALPPIEDSTELNESLGRLEFDDTPAPKSAAPVTGE